MKKAVFILITFLAVSGVAKAEEIISGETKAPARYREFTLEPGYTFFSTEGNPYHLNEYSKSRSAGFFSGSFNDLSPKNKFIAAFDVYEKDARYLNFHWYYKDKLRLELSDESFIHNLDHKQLLVSPSLYDKNLSDKYEVDIGKRFLSLKYKPFEYPFHIRFYLEGLEKDGTIQKTYYGIRGLDPATNTGNIYSRSRRIQLETESVMGALDGVIGGVNFFVKADNVSFSNKTGNTPDGLLKYPVLNRDSQMLKLYSNNTGKITWTVQFNRMNTENSNRDEIGRDPAEMQYYNTTAVFSYNPFKELKTALKVSYEIKDEHNPDAVRFLSADYPVKDAVSYERKTADFNLRYYFTPGWNLKLSLKRKEMTRAYNRAYRFDLPDYTYTNAGLIGLDGKIGKSLSVKLSQKAENTHNPSYNNTPENLYNTKVSLAYDINDRTGVDFTGEYSYGKNNDPARFFRDNKTYNYILTCWYNPAQNLSLNFYANYDRQEYHSDLLLGSTDRADNVPYKSSSVQSGVNANLNLSKTNTVYTDVFYLRGYGTYRPPLIAGTYPSTVPYDTASLAYLADSNFYQYGILIGDRMKFGDKSSLKLELGYKDHEEKTQAPLSGSVKTVFVSWEQKW